MKTADIKVGQDYAYLEHTYPTQVTVLATKVERSEGWGYSKRTIKNGVRVRYANGNEGVVPTRKIERPWDEQVRINKAQAEAREQSDQAARNTAARRARQAAAIERVLANHGVAVQAYPATFYKDHAQAALVAVGFEVGTGQFGHREGVITRIERLDDYMAKGILPESVTTVLLADAEVAAREVL